MTTNNEALDALSRLIEQDQKVPKGSMTLGIISDKTNHRYKKGFIEGYNAAKAESEKEIAELQESVKKWQENSVDLEYKCLDKNLRNAELQSQVNMLREALFTIRDSKDGLYGDNLNVVNKALSTTPAQSLAEHDAELIERCAKVCDAMEYRHNSYDMVGCGDSIREMKGKE